MIKVLLADDNQLTLNQVSEMIATSGVNAVVVGQAMDGETAAKLLFTLRPNVLITDIDMPVMNGVELSAFVAERKLPVKVIALSNYDSYEFVRPVMKHGAMDYLLKHEMTPGLLRAKLLEAGAILRVEESTTAREEVYSLLARQEFLRKLLLGIVGEEEQWQIMLQQAEFQPGRRELALIRIINYRILYHNKEEADLQRLSQSVLGVCNSICSTLGNGIACEAAAGEYVVVFHFPGSTSKGVTRQKATEYLATLSGNLERLLGLHLHCHLEGFDNGIETIRIHYMRARLALNSEYGLEENNRIAVLDEKRMLDALTRADRAAIREMVFDTLSQGCDVQEVVVHLLRISERLLASHNLPHSSVQMELVQDHFRRGIQPEAAGDILSDYLCEVGDMVRKFMLEYSRHVREAIVYIHEHYHEDMSQDVTARAIGITTVHLSRLFRAETGSTFIDYLTSYRLDIAKEILKEGTLSVKEVSHRVGFQNSGYFIKVFRKHVGVTPFQYRKEQWAEG
ncbi:helix-turn-helix domain-containing protein [Ruminococcaceae bacterium OttesenSCG-928-L11]|nr:helix-turn-helix domain-containing protein [Ruminococcaceae bacterium OttesenSCG-928-L11]